MNILIRPLLERDLSAAERIFRLAFGTFLGLPDPLRFGGDTDSIRTRWMADRNAALGAEMDGELVATNFVANWGSLGLFGPLTVRPDLWDRGIAKLLLEATMELFGSWGVTHSGLFTHAESPKHIGLYQKYGFWPRFLTAIMSLSVGQVRSLAQVTRYSELADNEAVEYAEACRAVTDSIYSGLDLRREIFAVNAQKLGDTLLLWDGERVVGFAVCHCGANTEAGSDTCYVKFAAVTSEPIGGSLFDALLDACEAFAADSGMSRLVAGVNTARNEAYRRMLARGFRTVHQGVAMQKPNEPAYNRAEAYVIDDWR
ncbi:MAG: GNAT family N-acetyltransferase [Deltaproteobacteria bacterium]|nr:MAG: GNAT family N-acetyltransferase [Deltaproteobacteria bacterium]